MIIQREIRLLKPILAARPPRDPKSRREFDRVKSEEGIIRLPMNMQRWEWAFLEARDSLGFKKASVACITPSTSFDVKLTSTYTRTFRRGSDGAPQSEQFECVPSGASIRWEWVLSSSLPPHVEIGELRSEPPDVAQFDAMLDFIGSMLGMSEWGNHYGFGRFEVVAR